MLHSTVFEEHASSGYRGRTLRNASADVTFAFAADFTTAGERLTKRYVLEQDRIYCPISYRGQLATANAIQAAVSALNRAAKTVVTVNIAGNGLYTIKHLGDQSSIDRYAHDFLRRVLADQALEPTISLVRSGGQTGFDEAGIKAAQTLGLRTLVLAPKGWTFRRANGQDISDERAFKHRFHEHLSLENHHEAPSMSIDLFCKNSIKTEDLGKTLGDVHMYSDMVQGIRGFVYEHGLYIESTNKDFVLTIGNDITRSTSLWDLEQKLYDWAVEDGYEFVGTPYVAKQKIVSPNPAALAANHPCVYTAESAIKAIRARVDGVWDDPDLMKVGPLFSDELDDIHRIVQSVSPAYVPTPMERMLAETLRAMAEGGGHYDDGDFFIEATPAERAGGAIKVVDNAFEAVRVYDEALGRYGKEKLNPSIPDFSEQSAGDNEAFNDVVGFYQEQLRSKPGEGLIAHVNPFIVVLGPDGESVYFGTHLDGPEVVDVRELMPCSNTLTVEHTDALFDPNTKAWSKAMDLAFVKLPMGFDQSLRDELERREVDVSSVHAAIPD